MSDDGMPTAFQFDMLPSALQNAIGQGGKLDVRLASNLYGEARQKGTVSATGQ
jgi:hypothetical protein